MADNTITFENESLDITINGLDKLWSFKGSLKIPYEHISGATLDDGALNEPKGLKWPGLRVPGKYAGTFILDDEKTFYNASAGKSDVVVIQLHDEEYVRLVLSVDNGNDIVDKINQHVMN
jgi:hypothetical protein